MKCKKCGQEIDKKAVVCTGCGCKVKKPFYKKWWIWAIAVIIVVAVFGSSNNGESPSNVENGEVEEVLYEVVDLQTMLDDLSNNAMKAESLYKKKNIEFKCKIANFDSDGSYIGVKPVNASDWSLTTAICYIKNEEQTNFLVQKSVGDSVTIKGKVKSIGEVLGYSIDIKEIY